MRREEATSDVTARPDRRLAGVRVLVVDDNLDQLDIMSALLGHAGADVSVARTAQEAFDSFCADRPHVVLSDLVMPQATGYSLIRRIRASRRGNAVPVVAITACHEDEHRKKALESGFNEWIAKPAIDMIVGLIARLTGRR